MTKKTFKVQVEGSFGNFSKVTGPLGTEVIKLLYTNSLDEKREMPGPLSFSMTLVPTDDVATWIKNVNDAIEQTYQPLEAACATCNEVIVTDEDTSELLRLLYHHARLHEGGTEMILITPISGAALKHTLAEAEIAKGSDNEG